MNVVSLEKIGFLAVITIDHPPVNALSKAVCDQLSHLVAGLSSDGDLRVVLLKGANGVFSAGSDISEFGEISGAEAESPDLAKIIEGSAIPVVAAIEGIALGGGLELTMACHYRVASTRARLGLPEIHLGLLPGGGGTQRLPRLIGLENALGMILDGRPVQADRAMSLGLVDAVLSSGDFLEEAIEFARNLASGTYELRKASCGVIEQETVPPGFFDSYSATIAKHSSGSLAPRCIVDCVKAAVGESFENGFQVERELFQKCLASAQSKALRYLFFAERQTTKIPEIARDTATRDIRSVAVLGAGTMGGGVAMCFANAVIHVKLLDLNAEALERGLDLVRRNYLAGVKKGRMTEQQSEQVMALIQGTTDYEGIGEADLVIEAVFENMNLKKEIFGMLDKICKPGAILASNTSSLDINRIAASTTRPEDVVGLHFFSPANVMRLLEVVRSSSTSGKVVATSMALGKRLGKIPVLSGVCPGFIGNRIVAQYSREANLMMLEGVAPERIDNVMMNFGFPMGPCVVGDMVGLDIGVKAGDEARLMGQWNGDERDGAIARVLVENGRLGLKSGAGFYRYEPGSRKPLSDPLTLRLIRHQAERLGVEPGNLSDTDILNRCLYSMINEAAQVLGERIALRSSDIDVVLVNGYGFPRARGGLLFYADSVGVDLVYQAIGRFQHELDDTFGYWKPSSLLETLAREGSTFGAS